MDAILQCVAAENRKIKNGWFVHYVLKAIVQVPSTQKLVLCSSVSSMR
jgi:hypothetical protein